MKQIVIEGVAYRVLGAGKYRGKNNPEARWEKVFLEGHKVLLIAEGAACFGVDRGRIAAFDGMPGKVRFGGDLMIQVNHDFQVEIEKEGETEGACEFWDYEGKRSGASVSVAVLGDGRRSDVELREIKVPDGGGGNF